MGNVLADALIRLQMEEYKRKKDEYNARLAALKAENEAKREQTIAGFSRRESTNDVKGSTLPDTFQPSTWDNNERLFAQRLAVKQYMDMVGYQDMRQASKTKALVEALHEAERKIDTGREYAPDTIEYGETAYRSDTNARLKELEEAVLKQRNVLDTIGYRGTTQTSKSNALVEALLEAERQQHTRSGLLTDAFTNTNKNGIINVTQDTDTRLALSKAISNSSNPEDLTENTINRLLKKREQELDTIKNFLQTITQDDTNNTDEGETSVLTLRGTDNYFSNDSHLLGEAVVTEQIGDDLEKAASIQYRIAGADYANRKLVNTTNVALGLVLPLPEDVIPNDAPTTHDPYDRPLAIRENYVVETHYRFWEDNSGWYGWNEAEVFIYNSDGEEVYHTVYLHGIRRN